MVREFARCTEESRLTRLAQREPDQGARSPVEQLIKEVAGRAVKQEAKRGKICCSGQRVLPAARCCLSAAGTLHARKVRNAQRFRTSVSAGSALSRLQAQSQLRWSGS